MRDFDLGRTFDSVFIAANSLLQELPLLLALGGLRLSDRFGDWSGRSFTGAERPSRW
jgi:hypothetical protein